VVYSTDLGAHLAHGDFDVERGAMRAVVGDRGTVVESSEALIAKAPQPPVDSLEDTTAMSAA